MEANLRQVLHFIAPGISESQISEVFSAQLDRKYLIIIVAMAEMGYYILFKVMKIEVGSDNSPYYNIIHGNVCFLLRFFCLSF